jgi:hypothetical protein
MSYTNRFIGIDISKSSFDICVLPENKSASFSNDASGIAQFLAFVARLDNVARLVLEPTGGYERPVVDALLAAHLPVARVNANQIRQFARACGQLSKTDRIDAFVLADYARRMETKVLAQSSPAQTTLVDLVARYRQLSHMIVQEKNRREKLRARNDDRAKAWIEETLAFLVRQRQIGGRGHGSLPEVGQRLSRKGNSSHLAQGHRPANRLLPDCRPSRTWTVGQRSNRKACRPCTGQPRQWPDAGQANDQRWPKTNKGCALRRSIAGNPLRSGDESPLRPIKSQWETRKGRSCRSHAQDDCHSKRENERLSSNGA